MIKILWADDQTDVVNTFSSILAPLSAKIIFVGNGNEAVKKLKTEHFDILLLDLKMPPEEWGGLWALEEIREFNQKIPVIIISGEGTQNETIRALRLGAQDYVTKDNVQIDLLQRVELALQKTNIDALDDLTNNFPTPIALLYKRYINTPEPAARLHRLLEFFESYLRFCCIVGLCEIRSIGELKSNEFDKYKSIIQSPSMGAWNQSRFSLAKYLSRGTVFEKLNSYVESIYATALIKIRNDIVHGSEPSETLATQYLRNHETGLGDFVKKLWQGIDLELVLPNKFQFDGTKYELDGVLVMGSNNVLPKANCSTSIQYISNQTYLNQKSSETWINLFPFIALEPSTEPASWKVMIFDGLNMDKNIKNVNGDESIKYIDIFSGTRNFTPTSRPVSKSLPKFLTGL